MKRSLTNFFGFLVHNLIIMAHYIDLLQKHKYQLIAGYNIWYRYKSHDKVLKYLF